MLAQTRAAVEILKSAGYDRKSFTVRTKRNSDGEYEEPQILVFGDKELQIKRAKTVVALRINVTLFIDKRTGNIGWPLYSLAYGKAVLSTIKY